MIDNSFCEHTATLTSDAECSTCAKFRAQMHELWSSERIMSPYEQDPNWQRISGEADKHEKLTKHVTFLGYCYDKRGCNGKLDVENA